MNPNGTNQQPSPAVQQKLTNDVVPPKPGVAPQQPVLAAAIPVAQETYNEPGMFPIGAEHSLPQPASGFEQKTAAQSQTTLNKVAKPEPKKTSGKHWLVIGLSVVVSAVLILFAVLAFKQSN